MKKSPIPLTPEEMELLIAATEGKNLLYWRALFMFAKTTGRRLGEIYAVRVSDIDFEKGVAMTNIEKARKFKRMETILTPMVVAILKRYIKEARLKPDDYVFRAKSYRQIQARTTSLAKKAGIQHNVTFHNFRHYFITELVRKGWSYDKIRKVTGHASINVLMKYDHVVASDIKADVLRDVE